MTRPGPLPARAGRGPAVIPEDPAGRRPPAGQCGLTGGSQPDNRWIAIRAPGALPGAGRGREGAATLGEFTLEGHGVRQEPLAPGHAAGLAAAGDGASYAYTWVPDGPEGARACVATALAGPRGRPAGPVRGPRPGHRAGRRVHPVPGAGRARAPGPLAAGAPGPEPSGDRPPTVAGIGSTWYGPPWQRTRVNPACKLLLLERAFSGWGAIRVTLKTDARNAAPRAAIERLGARLEGVRRAHHLTADATVRDSAYYSVLAPGGRRPASG